MRYFELVNIEHFVLYLFPTLAFILLFAIGLGFYYFRTKDSEERLQKIIESYPGGIEGREAPFPLILTLTIIGTVLWVLAYIILTGLLGVKI
jgi:hypothetical protein